MKSVLIQGTLAFALLSQSVQGGVIIKSNFRQYSDVDSLAGHVEGSSSVGDNHLEGNHIEGNSKGENHLEGDNHLEGNHNEGESKDDDNSGKSRNDDNSRNDRSEKEYRQTRGSRRN